MIRKKRTLPIILALLVIALVVVGIRLLTAQPTVSTDPATASTAPADTAAASDDASPAPTNDTPTAPANPAVTGKPAATAAPSATSEPTATAASSATSKPTATATPSATTSKPAATATSSATSKPATTETPAASDHSAAPGNPMATGEAPSIDITEESKGLLDGIKIGIDPGHQTHSNSAQEPVSPGSKETKAKVSSGTQGVKTRVPEYEVNLQVALLLRDALEAQGATVYMTRDTNDVDISNIERAEMMNELGVDVVLRLHCNGSTNQETSGIGLYVKSSGDGAEESYAISEVLIAAMGEATGAKTESVHVRDTYSGLNWSTVPSILVEMGYMSNPDEDEKLCSDEYQTELVHGMVEGLITYFSERAAEASSSSPEASVSPVPEKK